MQPIFTMQYAEYKAAEIIKEKIKDCSIYIPISAQEKGIDFVAVKYDKKHGGNKTCGFQVKMSRSYSSKNFEHSLWFNKVKIYDNADWFLLVGIYPKNLSLKNQPQKIQWNQVVLAFTNAEMKEINDKIRQKRNPDKPDSKFGFGFDDEKEIYLTRGYPQLENFSKYLLHNRIAEIQQSFK